MIHKFTQWFICTGQQSSVRWRENKLITGHFPRAGNGGGFAAWFVVCLQSACKQNFNAFQALHGYHRVKLNIKYFYESELSPVHKHNWTSTGVCKLFVYYHTQLPLQTTPWYALCWKNVRFWNAGTWSKCSYGPFISCWKTASLF